MTDGWTDGRTDDGACLYYKFTYEPKCSGELKSMFGEDIFLL